MRRRVFAPRSVAVVGASGRSGSLPARTLDNLVAGGFDGPIYPVNPGYEELAGRRCYPSLGDVPEPVDLAVVVVAAAQVPEVIDDCVAAGVGTAVVFAGGFAETGAEGQAAQEAIAAAARGGGLRLLGPNCQGLIHQPSKLVATFSAAVRAGLGTSSGVAYLGQSGALGGSFLGLARERGIGITAWCSVGNQSGVTVCELADELLDDPAIRVLVVNLETIPEGTAWQAVLDRAAQRDVALVLLRSGRSEAGRAAAKSHTGAMVSADAAFDLVSAAGGAIAVHDADELLDTVAAALNGRRPLGPRIAVVTTSGGAGALAADHVVEAGLEMAVLSDATRAALAEVLPAFGSSLNPVDVTAQLFVGEPDAFARVCATVVADPGVDALVIVLSNVLGQAATTVAESLVEVVPTTDVPIAVTWMAAVDETADARAALHDAGVGVHGSIRAPIGTAARLMRRVPAPRMTPGPPRDLAAQLPDGAATITEAAGAALLDALGIAHPEQELAATPADAAAIAARLGGELVLKLQSAQITHKTEAGALRVGVAVDDVERAGAEMVAAGDAVLDGILVQRRAGPGLELLVGVEGAQHGYPPVVTVGLGGAATELLRDVASALAPLHADGAEALLRALRSWPLLAGHRGRPPLDIGAAVAAVVSVSEAAAELGERLVELEINPLLVHAQGATAIDFVAEVRAAAS